MRRGFLGALAVGVLLLGWGVSPSFGSVSSPGFAITAVGGPTIFSPEHGGALPDSYVLTVTNLGSTPTDGSAITVADTLPAGLIVKSVNGNSTVKTQENGYTEYGNPLECTETTVTAVCIYNHVLRPGEHLYVMLDVAVEPGTVGPVTSSATVSGGGASAVSTSVNTEIGTAAQSKAVPFGLAFFSEQVTGANGATDTQAGDHPFETSLSYSLNTVDELEGLEGAEYVSGGGLNGEPAQTKDVVVDLPPGFVGNPDTVERCPQDKVSAGQCSPASQIGVASIVIFGRPLEDGTGAHRYNEPIYNMVPDKGYPAQFEFALYKQIPVVLQVRTNQDTNYGVQVLATGIPQAGPPTDVSVTFFGTPSTDPHVENELSGSGIGAGMPHTAFLSNPVDCSTKPQVSKLYTDSWQHPGRWLADGSPDFSDPNWLSYTTTLFPEITGCNLLQFSPSLTVTPEVTQADEPTGVTVGLGVPQAQQMTPDLATPELKDASVTLPLGLSLSPSAGDGLQGCSDEQVALSSPTPAACPLASQVGTVKITTPLLSEPLEGQVFLGTPHCDPCTNADASDGNMFRIFLQAQGSGVVVKKQGTVYANTTTGQLTTTFEDNPELPFSNLQLSFKGGLRAALATPQSCGTFATTSDLTPWSAPITPDATPSSPFNIDWDGNGGACPATPPFSPSFSAGTSNPNAGQFSPLTLTFGRQDREQDLAAIQVHTPPGLLGMLSSVTLCGEPQADLGTCTDASRIGSMTVAAGPGSHPFYERGSIYLTGPYSGAPFGLSIVVPTVAGPFNLGNVVVRARINVDVHTAGLTVTSDPLPQILDGIPLRLRTTNVTIDRPGFIFNPTNCAQQQISATISGAEGAQASLSTPFAVAGCSGIHFGPKFLVSTSGHTSRANGASLDAKLVYPTGPQSNITKVKVDLPKQLPSRLATLQHACTDIVFNANPAACPRGSLIGTAKAVSPVLPVPLVGPAYFVSHGDTAFPDLVVILEGYGVRIDLVGSTFISTKGITSSTFKTVPDVPVTSFELYLPQGPGSALAANGNLCKSTLSMPTTFVAQDGAQLKQATKVKVTGCPKAKKVRKTKAKKPKKAGSARSAGNAHAGQRRGDR